MRAAEVGAGGVLADVENAAVSDGRIPHNARPLADREADGLVGWMMHSSSPWVVGALRTA